MASETTNLVFNSNNPSSPTSISTSKTALLLLDFHTAFIKMMPPSGQEAVTTATKLRQWARTQNMPIVHCLIDFRQPIAPHRKMAKRGNQFHDTMTKSNDPNAPGEIADLQPLGDEYVFWRPLGLISALSSYGLAEFLKCHDIKSVLAAGVVTSGCVIDTAKAVAESGIMVTVVRDACADHKVEIHDVVLDTLLDRTCHVATLDEIVAAPWKQ